MLDYKRSAGQKGSGNTGCGISQFDSLLDGLESYSSSFLDGPVLAIIPLSS